MRSGRTPFLKIAFVLFGATAFSLLRAADSAPAPTAAAPEKIEFSRTTSTAPKVPRPGVKTDDLLNRFGNVRDLTPGAPDLPAPMLPQTMRPSRAMAEKRFKEWDKQKNWAFQRPEDSDGSDSLTKFDNKKDDDLLVGEKPKDAVERYIEGEDPRKKKDGRLRDSEDRRDNLSLDGKNSDRDRGRDDKKDKDDRDRNSKDNEPTDFATFNLKNFIRQQNAQPNFVNDNYMPKASQLFRSEIGTAGDPRQLQKEKAERDARSAEFNQILKPRFSGVVVGVNDPINSPDLTRREMNPITPRALESSPASRSPFAPPPPSAAARIQENNMFGVTGPAASSITPAVTAPPVSSGPNYVRPIVIDTPKRPFN